MVRRGSVTIPSVPTQKLVTFIRKRALLGTDEISGDGTNWVRVDRHYQLSKYFSSEAGGNVAVSAKTDLNSELEFSEDLVIPPRGFENDLQKVADLLKDINE